MDGRKRRSGSRFGYLGNIEYFSYNKILSDKQLKKLKEHKYNCQNESLFDPYLQPYWNWLVTKLPVWLAPNLITTIGLFVNIVTSLILVYHSPDGKQDVPAWACILCALGLFFYQSLDAIDGKQARRTNSQSPLGELFDHGCDSVSTVFVSLGVCVSCRLGDTPALMFMQCFIATTLFYCAHWQAYVAGALRFGRIDVTEAQIGIIIAHLISAAFGNEFWTYSMIPGWNCPIYYLYVLVGLGGALPALYSEFGYILYRGAGKNGSSVAGTSVLSPVIPYSFVIFPAVLIAWRSEENIYGENPAVYILMFGMVAAKITNRLVVAHMTKSEMDYFDMALLGPFMIFMNQYFNCVFREKHLLWVSLVLATVELYRYCSKVCVEICDSLGIYLFRIEITAPEATTSSSRKVSTAKSNSHS